MKAMLGLLFGFGLALAVVIGQRLTMEDLSIVAGVAVGVVASMPVALVLVLLHRANERQTRRHLTGIAPQQAPERATGHLRASSDYGARCGATASLQGVSTRPQARADILPPYVHHRGEVVIDLDESEYRRFGFDVPGQRVRRYRGYRSGDASAAVPIIETLTPAREPNVRADFATPALQSLFSGLVGALVAAVVAWKTGGDVVTWLIVGFVAALAISWAVSLGLVRDLLWTVERITADAGDEEPADDAGHGMVMNAGAARQDAGKKERSRERALRLADLLTFAQKCATVGCPERSHGIKPGTPQQEAYRAKRDLLISLGIGRWKNPDNHNLGWMLAVNPAEAAEILRHHVMDVGST